MWMSCADEVFLRLSYRTLTVGMGWIIDLSSYALTFGHFFAYLGVLYLLFVWDNELSISIASWQNLKLWIGLD